MNLSIFKFDGYTVRPVTEADRQHLAFCIEQDEYHAHKMNADFFLKLQPGEESLALEDQQGRVVYYCKTSVAIRVDLQFTPVSSIRDVQRNGNALLKGLAWLEGLFRAKHYREIITDPDGPELYAFCKNRLGFTERPILSRVLRGAQGDAERLGTVPTFVGNGIRKEDDAHVRVNSTAEPN